MQSGKELNSFQSPGDSFQYRIKQDPIINIYSTEIHRVKTQSFTEIKFLCEALCFLGESL
jgi:hypothetical protein